MSLKGKCLGIRQYRREMALLFKSCLGKVGLGFLQKAMGHNNTKGPQWGWVMKLAQGLGNTVSLSHQKPIRLNVTRPRWEHIHGQLGGHNATISYNVWQLACIQKLRIIQ